jgi:hypothetical protein
MEDLPQKGGMIRDSAPEKYDKNLFSCGSYSYEGRTRFLKSRGVRLVYFLNARSKLLMSLNPAE